MSVFKTIKEDKKLYQGENFFLIYDAYPVSKGHILIISNEKKIAYIFGFVVYYTTISLSCFCFFLKKFLNNRNMFVISNKI